MSDVKLHGAKHKENRLRMGIAGCGDIAGYTALLARLVPRLKITACCDVNPERRATFARRHHIPQVFASYADMLAHADLDAVYLAVPHDLHYEMILAAAQAGKQVLTEKPLARTVDEGLRLCTTINGRKIGVNYQYRYDAGCYALARAVQQGALGRVSSVRINVPWRRAQSYFDGSPWHRTIARAGGGTLITQGSHLLDVALWALGELPVSAVGYIASPGFEVEVETLAQGIVQTDGGTLVSITSTMAAASEQALSIEMYGARGTAVYTDRPWPRVKFRGVNPTREKLPQRGVHALHRSLAGFVSWVLDSKPFLTPLESSLPVLAAVEAIYCSARSGRREPIDPGIFSPESGANQAIQKSNLPK